ncbi:carbon-nitrogen hydrolase family protein [Natronogracilivirga saccharolytica]|uniref:Carbon-nitrogen hydrolase family protein n=1 Tax=Natronogracilivirga saccharolytica TaxID=2812953 RepID=A0A8J7UU10_9BACT|nr:carbon-nitrogen hydrolase family protein [Natronogracilivirga saccharolytica]MBP3191915.1 carbon-nitrogen hydrolase family protein [Natronogracilivirga saccharolytica]
MGHILAAAIQMNSQPDLEANMADAGRFVGDAAARGASFVALPENFAFLGDEKEKHRQAETIAEAVMQQIPALSKKYGISILAGGFPVRAGSGKVYNRAVFFDPGTGHTSSYDKIHMFDIRLSDEESYMESDTVESGRTNAVVHDGSCGIRFGLSICYDVRFPELYRRLASRGAEVLCVPSAFTRPTGEAHWEVLLRARAIENTCYVIAPAQTGFHGEKRKTHGHTMIIDPWGNILDHLGTETGMALAEIDISYLQSIRKKLPSLQHYRLDI